MMSSPAYNAKPSISWKNSAAYEHFIGRWSRLIGKEFLTWLSPVPGIRWLDVGCGTGALSEAIFQLTEPLSVIGIDLSEDFVTYCREHIPNQRASFEKGDALTLPFDAASFDAAVSGLVHNFLPQNQRALAEMKRVVRPGGMISLYVWDYGSKMQLLRHFWNAAKALDPTVYDLDEGRRFSGCKPEPLVEQFTRAGLEQIKVTPIDVWTDFKDFDDYWTPFQGGQGPAPTYTASLDSKHRAALRELLKASLPAAVDGSIPLIARAWAVCGIR
jgi:ubiquinone/menaquinone biosynthesis C-methylase UbiE